MQKQQHYFEEILQDFSPREIRVCHYILATVNRHLVDGLLTEETFNKLLREKGRL